MSVKTEIWVKAHLRRCFAAGLTGVVARRGAAEAGAVFVKVTLPRAPRECWRRRPGRPTTRTAAEGGSSARQRALEA
jgi:hypothetical protein